MCEDYQGPPGYGSISLRRREGREPVCRSWELSGLLFQAGEGSCGVDGFGRGD